MDAVAETLQGDHLLRIILAIAMGGSLALSALYANIPYLLVALALALPLPISMARGRRQQARSSDEDPSAPTDDDDWVDPPLNQSRSAPENEVRRHAFLVWLDEIGELDSEADDYYPSDERVPDDDPATRNRRIRENRRALIRAQQRRPAPTFTDEATSEPEPRSRLTRVAELSGVLSLLVSLIALIKEFF